ncbi:MAG: alpha/beta fold hydrolase [archaeon]
MPEVKTDRAMIHYIEKGTGEVTLLFIHGWGINSSYWNDQLEYFSKDYKVIAIDLPGFGKSKSDRNQWTRQNYGQDIIDLIDKLSLKNVILIGHSMSGDVILEAALTNHNEIKGIIGIDNFKMLDVSFTPEQIEEITTMSKAIVSDYKNSVPFFAESLFHPGTPADVRKRVTDDFVNSDEKVAIATLFDMSEYFKIMHERVSKLNYKLYLINSDFGPTNTQGLEKYCPKSFDVSYIHATGHYPMIEKPEEFNKLLELVIKNNSYYSAK